MRTTGTPAARTVVAALLLLGVGLALVPRSRPAPEPANAPAADFSAARAMALVREIARAPHPIGTPEHDRVRDYVMRQFTDQGLTPEIQRGHAEVTFGSYHGSGDVENIVARLPGSANTRPVMLAAHYDSVPRGPGAGDDGHGTAVLLETLRALRTGPPLRNDVIFLVTDGEERGMLGAIVFMRDHPWRHQPGVVLNFEARGTAGSAVMFETSAGNEWLIHGLHEAVPQADATSVSYEIYRRMPNNTDLTVFKGGGLAGMNFAFIEHPDFYHTTRDNPDNVDPVSVQEQGRYALSLARWFGGQNLSATPPPENVVYFPTAFTPLVAYSITLAKVLAVVAFLATLAAAWRGRWESWPLLPLGLLGFLVALSVPGLSYLFGWPVLGGAVAAILLTGPPPERGVGPRVILAGLCAIPTFLLLLPLVHMLVVALSLRGAAPILGAIALIVLVCVLPQLSFVLRRTKSARV